MKKLTAQQQVARDERRVKFRTLVEQLAAMTDEERAAKIGHLGFIKLSSKEAYSPSNMMLIAFQSTGRATPTILGGFAEWMKQGRAVKKGEHGYMVWVPIGARKQGAVVVTKPGEPIEPETDIHFTTGTVFDISQTELKEVEVAV